QQLVRLLAIAAIQHVNVRAEAGLETYAESVAAVKAVVFLHELRRAAALQLDGVGEGLFSSRLQRRRRRLRVRLLVIPFPREYARASGGESAQSCQSGQE